MGSILSASRSSLHTLIANVSGLFGILVFLQKMWGPSSLENTLLTAASAGLAAYLILALGYAAARSLLRDAERPARNEEAGDALSDDAEAPSEAAAESESPAEATVQDPENVAEPQAA